MSKYRPMKGLKMFPFKNWDKEIEESLANMVSLRQEPEVQSPPTVVNRSRKKRTIFGRSHIFRK